MSINDIPDDLLSMIRRQFDNDPKVRHLYVQQGIAKKNGNFVEVLRLARMLDDLFSSVVLDYMMDAEKQVEKINIDNIDMPLEEKEKILCLGLVMFMCSDIIESAIQDVDSVLHRYDRELHFEMFNDIRQIASMAKEKLKFLRKNSSYLEDTSWADKADNMYEMMQSKVKVLMRKQKEKKGSYSFK